jgi:hypothetical protein
MLNPDKFNGHELGKEKKRRIGSGSICYHSF